MTARLHVRMTLPVWRQLHFGTSDKARQHRFPRGRGLSQGIENLVGAGGMVGRQDRARNDAARSWCDHSVIGA